MVHLLCTMNIHQNEKRLPLSVWHCQLIEADTVIRQTGMLGGSDIHVMLALCRSSRQVVVADKQLDRTDRMRELLGTRQRFTDQPGHALAPRVVEPLDMVGFPRQLADRPTLRRRHLRP